MLEILMFISVFLFLIWGLYQAVSTLTVNQNFSGLVSGNSQKSATDALGIQAAPYATNPVPVAQAGALTTHTTNSTGTLTMNSPSHGLTTGQRVDIYWAGGQCYGAVLGTVAGLSCPIASVSGGSNLPTAGTAVAVAPTISVPFGLTGNNLSGLILYSASKPAYFVFNNGSADVFAAYVGVGANYNWFTGLEVAANPLAGATPTTVYFSVNDTAAAHTDLVAAAVAH